MGTAAEGGMMSEFEPVAPAAAPPSSAKRLHLLGPGTLSRQLILRIAALVAAMALAMGYAGVLMLNRIYLDNLDADLRTMHLDFFGEGGGHPGGGQPMGPGNSGLMVHIVDDTVTQNQLYGRSAITPLSGRQLAVLRAVNPNGDAETVDLPGLGDYGSFRVSRMVQTVTFQSGLGTYVEITEEHIVGLSMTAMSSITGDMFRYTAIIGIATVILAGIGVGFTVRHSLRGLNTLVDVASQVADKSLDRGEVELAERVPGTETNPNNEVGRVGLALNTMLDNVEEALAARQASESKVRRFVADASHELRNPLASIRGYAELTRHDRDSLPTDTAFAFSRIEAESERMSKLVEELLLLARLDAGREFNVHEVDVIELVANAVADAQAAGPDHNWEISLPDDASVAVMADEYQLHQVIANLLSNARKHTPAGTNVLTVVQVVEDAGCALIEVSDDGPGIPDELRGKVFERFVRADEARTHDAEGSTGLGLSIVAAVIAAHGGRVWVESGPAGTKFTALLPLAPPATETVAH
jgi:two-component system OmpR family sensor kinase